MAHFLGAEILELEDGQTVQLTIVDWEIGTMEITGRTFPGTKEIRVLRVRVPEHTKTLGPPYWDITGQRLIEQMLPHLNVAGFERRRFIITKHGVAPTAKFQLKVEGP